MSQTWRSIVFCHITVVRVPFYASWVIFCYVQPCVQGQTLAFIGGSQKKASCFRKVCNIYFPFFICEFCAHISHNVSMLQQRIFFPYFFDGSNHLLLEYPNLLLKTFSTTVILNKTIMTTKMTKQKIDSNNE